MKRYYGRCGFLSLLFLVVFVPLCCGYNLSSNGDFGSGLADWLELGNQGLVQKTTGTGNPIPGARLYRVETTTSVNENGIYQAIPVTSGKSYQVYGQWKGDLRAGVDVRNWAEVYIFFDDDGVLQTSELETANPGIVFKKRYDPDAGERVNIDETGIWDWQDITASFDPEFIGSNNFIADNSYLIVYINLGGRAASGNTEVFIDNIVVTACQGILNGDLNDDCVVDLQDLGLLASEWLDCNSELSCN